MSVEMLFDNQTLQATMFDVLEVHDARSSLGSDNCERSPSSSNDSSTNFTELVPGFKQEFIDDPLGVFESEYSLTRWNEKTPVDPINVDILDWMFTVDSCRRNECPDIKLEHSQPETDEHYAQKVTKTDPNPYSMTDLLRDYHFDDLIDIGELDLQIKDCLDCEYLCGDAQSLPNISSFIGPCEDLHGPPSLLFTPPSTPPKPHLPPGDDNDNHHLHHLHHLHHHLLLSPPSVTGTPSGKGHAGKNSKCHRDAADKKHFVKRPKKTKATHLWKFMRSLLDDPEYNPSFIKWENKEKGVFRIVPGQSKNIAKLWGQKKNNPTMTFDKLSRSLRWCREYGFLSKVPSNEGFPKKLCFRFGDRAMDWNGN